MANSELTISEPPQTYPGRSPRGMPLQSHEAGACRRDCCWTPFGHSGVVELCACHGSISQWSEYLERA